MRVMVRKCPFTGKLFEEEDVLKYIKHLEYVREEFKAERKAERIRKTFQDWLTAEKEKVRSINDLGQWVMDNQRHIMDAWNALNKDQAFYGKFNKDIILSDFKLGAIFDKKVSNTHHCPRGGVMNFRGRDDIPRSYPGFKGRMTGTLAHRDPRKYERSRHPTMPELLTIVDIHGGSGSGFCGKGSYEAYVFAADWPYLTEGNVFDILAGK